MMNLLRRFADIFRMDAIDMNALTGKARMKGSDRSSMLFLQGHLRSRYMLFVSQA
jgi:hypothetical protein